MASDIVIFATPLYIDNVSGLMKTFMDRLIALVDPHFEKDERGEYRHRKKHGKYPKFVVISNGNMPEQSHFQVLRVLFRRMVRSMHTELAAEVYRGSGGFLRSYDMTFKPMLEQYKQLLRKAGSELVRNGRISEQTAGDLERPMVDPDEYVEYANRQWDKMLSTT